MSACQKCWSDAHDGIYSDVAENYGRLLSERTGDRACTPEQQAGPDAAPCDQCGGRLVRHEITGRCMVDARHDARAEAPW